MNAQEALALTDEYWLANEEKGLAYIAGFETKVREATANGCHSALIGTVPNKSLSFVIKYFESLGYFVHCIPVSGSQVNIALDWHQIPFASRYASNRQDFVNSISFSEKPPQVSQNTP